MVQTNNKYIQKAITKLQLLFVLFIILEL